MSKNLQSVVVWFSFWLLSYFFLYLFWWLPLHKLSAKGFTSSNIWAEAAETESRYLQVLQSIRANSDCDSVGGFAASCNKSRNSTLTHMHTDRHTYTFCTCLNWYTCSHTHAGERRELAASVFDLALCFSLLGILIKNASTWNTNVLGVFGGNSGSTRACLSLLGKAVNGRVWAPLLALARLF